MNNVKSTVQTLIDGLGKLDISVAGRPAFTSELERVRGDTIKAVQTAPALKSISKACPSGLDLIADSVLVLGLITAMQRLFASKYEADWTAPQLGQARAHAYVDLWGRTQSMTTLLSDILSDSGSDMKSSQVAARLEVLTEGIKLNFSETSQALLMKGEGALVTPIMDWALKKFQTPAFEQLSGSILKELQSL